MKKRMVQCYRRLGGCGLDIVREVLESLGVPVKREFGLARGQRPGRCVDHRGNTTPGYVVVPRTHLFAVWFARRVHNPSLLRTCIRLAASGFHIRRALKVVVLANPYDHALSRFLVVHTELVDGQWVPK